MDIIVQGHSPKLPSWMKNVSAQELPEVYQEMAEVIGVEPTIHLASIFAGSSVYFPKLERALIGQRNRAIRSEFDGANIRELSRRWGLSARHVRQIVNPSSPPRADKEKEGRA